MQVLFHIGMGKCGSSSLQAFLTKNPDLKNQSGGRITYGVLAEKGTVLKGSAITRRSVGSPWGYVASESFRHGLKSADEFNTFASTLGTVPKRQRLILSNEGWWAETELLSDLASRSGSMPKVDVLMYVRDPISWLNSAWWQWGAWSKLNFPHWWKRNLRHIRWINTYKAWAALPFVSSVTLKLLPNDVVEEFCSHFDIALDDGLVIPDRVNQSLPNAILRIYQEYPELRSGPHEALNDFVLRKHLGRDGKPDWIVGPRVARKVVRATRKANEELLTVLGESDRERMLADPRWWSAEPFEGLKENLAGTGKIPYEDLVKLARDSLETILKLERTVAELEKENASLRQMKGLAKRALFGLKSKD